MRISDWSSDVCSSDLFDQRFSECLGTIAVIGITGRTQQIDERPTCRLRRIVVRVAFACFEQCSPRLEPIAPVVLYDEAIVAPGDTVASVERSREGPTHQRFCKGHQGHAGENQKGGFAERKTVDVIVAHELLLEDGTLAVG